MAGLRTTTQADLRSWVALEDHALRNPQKSCDGFPVPGGGTHQPALHAADVGMGEPQLFGQSGDGVSGPSSELLMSADGLPGRHHLPPRVTSVTLSSVTSVPQGTRRQKD